MVRDAESKQGYDIFASYAATAWLHYIAHMINEVEDELWQDWNADYPNHHMSLWEYEADTNAEGTTWDTDHDEHRFPRADVDWGLAHRHSIRRNPALYAEGLFRGNPPRWDCWRPHANAPPPDHGRR